MSHFADAEAAPVAIATVGFSSLKKGNCDFIFNSDAYKSAESAVNTAKTTVEQAKGKLDEAKKGVDASLEAAAIAKKECQCRTAQKAIVAYETASQNFAKDSKAAWTKAQHLQCVLNATPLKDCIVKDLPEIKKPTLAPGVTADACVGLGGCFNLATWVAEPSNPWTLVRSLAAGETWHPATDQLVGTDVYGDPSSDTFSIKFEDKVPGFNQFLFTTGDCAKQLVATKEAVVGIISAAFPKGNAWYDNTPRQVLGSSYNNLPYQARWYRRHGHLEDPWISLTNHDDAIRTNNLLYQPGENSFAWKSHAPLQGSKVYIRKTSLVYET